MATPKIVPRGSGEGGLGTAAKGWGDVFITNTTTSSATQGGKLTLTADDGAVMADNHRLGVIEFKGAEDTSNTHSIGARIEAICRDAWDASNNDAALQFYTTNGTTESKVLTLDADKDATFEGNVVVTSATDGIIHTNTGTVTQGTNITTGVTLNTTSGVITTHATAINADENVQFTVTNSVCKTTSVILLSMQDLNTVDHAQLVCATNEINNGNFIITLANTDTDAASSATANKIHFLIINPS